MQLLRTKLFLFWSMVIMQFNSAQNGSIFKGQTLNNHLLTLY